MHGPLQIFGPVNGVCNYLVLEKIYGMFILRIRAFLPKLLYIVVTVCLLIG